MFQKNACHKGIGIKSFVYLSNGVKSFKLFHCDILSWSAIRSESIFIRCYLTGVDDVLRRKWPLLETTKTVEITKFVCTLREKSRDI